MIFDAWFRFNDIDSRQMGVRVTKMPETVRAERRVERVEIAGRNGSLHVDEGTYASYGRTMECALINRRRLDEVAAWLVGSGKMIFSSEPDKAYDVMISNKISIAQMMRTFQKFQVTMDTQPFKRSVNPFGDTLELVKPQTVYNKGTVYAQPKITVYGSGSITLDINGTVFPLSGVDGHITVDSGNMEVYRGSESQNSRFGGAEFPRLEAGRNAVSWTGNVEKLVIEPEWRWI
ncbi:MAG: hypothetical protein HFE60_12160 [Anaerotignum sp.]|nr:hypothetical protein [Anaerotignum sp.]